MNDASPPRRGRRVRKPVAEARAAPPGAEARLRRALDTALQDQQQLRALIDTAPVMLARLDTDERYRFVNTAYARRFGLGPDHLIARHVADVIGPEAHAVLRPHLEAALAGRRVECEISVPYRDLGRRFISLCYVPEFDRAGRVSGVIAVSTDITDRRRAERALHQRERGFKTLAENSPDIIARVDRDLRHLYINRAVEAEFGLKAADCVGRTAAEAGLPDSVSVAWGEAARAAFASGQEQRFSARVDVERSRHYSGRAIPEYDRTGAAETVLLIVYNVTQRTQAEEEREALLAREQMAREQAEAAAHARDQFLAVVSHELRSPLNGIQSWAHVLEQQEGAKAPAFARALNGIRTGVEQQVRLIEDLLDATRIVSGQLRLAKQPFALRSVLVSALESVRASALAKQVGLHTRVALENEQLYGDPDRVQQILWNLLDNAIKFNAAGGNVWLEAERDRDSAVITVRDDGRGIPPDFLPFLFDRFRQADGSSTRRHEGLGLGLALVRHLTELHGGTVTAQSAGKGQGAIFHVALPLRQEMRAAAAAPPAAIEALPSLAGIRVLMVDDQLEARESLAALLAHAGASVITAGSGREALALLDAGGREQLPDILLCDIAMPEEDGYHTLRKVRTWESGLGLAAGQEMPAIALTAFALREDRARALASGYLLHLTKPVAPAELIGAIAERARRLEPA